MRKPTVTRIEQLERLADRVLRDDAVRPHIDLEMPALPERGWDSPRVFFVGEQPDGAEEALFEHEDEKPGWPSTSAVNAIMGDVLGQVWATIWAKSKKAIKRLTDQQV